MIAVLVMTDGRVDLLDQTVASLAERVTGRIGLRVLWDDTGDDEHFDYLRHTYTPAGWTPMRANAGREGFGGAIRSAWAVVRWTHPDYVFHVEDDFVFNRAVDLDLLADVLSTRPYLAQMALRRQAWNPVEKAAGGVVELHPDAYADCFGARARWLEHRLFWTTNPSLFRSAVLDLGWPVGPLSEGVFTRRLLDAGFDDVPAADVRFGYWGARGDGPWVTHIGAQRVGTGY